MLISINSTDVDTDDLAFHKSSFSQSGSCVEVAEHDGHRLVRDSKDQSGPVLNFTANEWTAFVAGVAFGEF